MITARTGILGGTFDPPHIGHLLLAECAKEQLGLSEVRLMVAGSPYHKSDRDVTAAQHRLAMVRLAAAGNDGLIVDEQETRRAGPTYTVDTLRALRADGVEEMCLILGPDSLETFRSWKDATEIESLASLAVVSKHRTAAEVERIAVTAGLERNPVQIGMPNINISSTMIRERIRGRQPVRYLVADSVLEYIGQHGLYDGES